VTRVSRQDEPKKGGINHNKGKKGCRASIGSWFARTWPLFFSSLPSLSAVTPTSSFEFLTRCLRIFNLGSYLDVQKPRTLFDRLGGDESIVSIVNLLYDKINGDDRLARFFNHVNRRHLQSKQKMFLTMIFGGPSDYDGQGICKIHRPLVENMGLSEFHFDIFVSLLQSTLQELRISEHDTLRVIECLLKWKDCVLCRNDWA